MLRHALIMQETMQDLMLQIIRVMTWLEINLKIETKTIIGNNNSQIKLSQ